MKLKITWMWAMFVFLMGMAVTACGDDEEEAGNGISGDANSLIVGEWKMVRCGTFGEVLPDGSIENIEEVVDSESYIFYADGSAEYHDTEYPEDDEAFTWKIVDGNKLYFYLEGEETTEDDYMTIATLNSTTLRLEDWGGDSCYWEECRRVN